MEEITGINHIGVRVENLEAARQFHEQLGFVFIIGPVGPEPVAIMEHPSGVNINLILNGGIMFFVRDPDKNVIEFHQDAV